MMLEIPQVWALRAGTQAVEARLSRHPRQATTAVWMIEGVRRSLLQTLPPKAAACRQNEKS